MGGGGRGGGGGGGGGAVYSDGQSISNSKWAARRDPSWEMSLTSLRGTRSRSQ